MKQASLFLFDIYSVVIPLSLKGSLSHYSHRDVSVVHMAPWQLFLTDLYLWQWQHTQSIDLFLYYYLHLLLTKCASAFYPQISQLDKLEHLPFAPCSHLFCGNTVRYPVLRLWSVVRERSKRNLVWNGRVLIQMLAGHVLSVLFKPGTLLMRLSLFPKRTLQKPFFLFSTCCWSGWPLFIIILVQCEQWPFHSSMFDLKPFGWSPRISSVLCWEYTNPSQLKLGLCVQLLYFRLASIWTEPT